MQIRTIDRWRVHDGFPKLTLPKNYFSLYFIQISLIYGRPIPDFFLELSQMHGLMDYVTDLVVIVLAHTCMLLDRFLYLHLLL